MARIEGVRDPSQVLVGRALKTDDSLTPYLEVVREYPAGRITIEGGETQRLLYNRMKRAARKVGVKITCSWSEDKQTLNWKKIQARASQQAAA